MGRTKKVGPAGKFGTRYGMRVRKKWLEVEKKQRISHECPVCKKPSVKRISTGIWQCRKCETKFAGGAYLPMTGVAQAVDRIIQRVSEEREGPA
jgi:large subunit ribosomal protein L37Ae